MPPWAVAVSLPSEPPLATLLPVITAGLGLPLRRPYSSAIQIHGLGVGVDV
jgi:hypothetical protein